MHIKQRNCNHSLSTYLSCLHIFPSFLVCIYLYHTVQVSCGFESTGYVVQETAGQVLACVSVPTSQRLMFDFNLTILSVSGTASK